MKSLVLPPFLTNLSIFRSRYSSLPSGGKSILTT